MEFRNYFLEALHVAECVLFVAYTVAIMFAMFIRFS